MNQNLKEKHQFQSSYCGSCKQTKPCQLLHKDFCCSCQFQMEQKKVQEYSTYQQVYQRKIKEREERIRQLKLLRNYQSCKQCGSKEVDAYELFKNSQLICQPCLMRKEGGSSEPVSFTGEQKWFRKRWGIDISWWLDTYDNLPVNAECARKWQTEQGHLPNKCDCLEVEAQKLYELFTNSFQKTKDKVEKGCQCKTSEKVRVRNDDYAWCESCEVSIPAASKKRVIKNRNDPRFWGLKIEQKILCGKCLEKIKDKMPLRKKYLFAEYQKRGYWV